jgi:hypothetical protein
MFRSAFFRENLLLIVLGLLSESELNEWEILNLLYSRYGSTPSAKEFRRLVESMVNGSYAAFVAEEGTRRLRLTKTGTKLLHRLEEEYRAVVSNAAPSQDRRSQRAAR